MPEFFCSFCNSKRPDKHISVCPKCGGQLHEGVTMQECATCGKTFPLAKKPVKEFPAPEPIKVEVPVLLEAKPAKNKQE